MKTRSMLAPRVLTALPVAAMVLAGLFAAIGRVVVADDLHGDKDDRHGTVWVVNRDRGELVVFDAKNGKVAATLPVGAGAHDIAISEQAGKAYITAETINQVTTVDTETLAVEAIDVSPAPHHIEPSRDGRTVYVSLASHPQNGVPAGTPQFAAIDTATNAVAYTTTSSNAAARSHGLTVSRDGATVFVAHDTGDVLTAVDTATGTLDFSVGPIPRAEESVLSRYGTYVWVSSRGQGTVKRIKIGRNAPPDSVTVGSLTSQPESIMLTPSEETVVVFLRGAPASLAFVNAKTLTLEGTLPIAETAGDLAVMTPDGKYVFATFDAGITGTGGVAVVHVRTRQVVDTWAYPGTGRPHGVWFSATRAPH